jgi:2-polyprenyl-3-methyl-5-hydroxy-6-metoxy-1,4-benzoquinol methylase
VPDPARVSQAREMSLGPGNGNDLTARWLASEGVSVLAADCSEQMLENAVRRAASPGEASDRVIFQRLDATVPEAFEELLETRWAVSSTRR